MKQTFEPLSLSPAIESAIVSGIHKYVYRPTALTFAAWKKNLRPKLVGKIDNKLLQHFDFLYEETRRVRSVLQQKKRALSSIAGKQNILFNEFDREAHATDSTEFRALPPEAVVTIYNAETLINLTAFCFSENIPMIPYGAGGGYNMGVVPMAPSITVSLKGMQEIGDVENMTITAQGGAAYKDIVAKVHRSGFVLRCQPNTPRASLSGIIASGSNGGKRIHDVLIGGKAVISPGKSVSFKVTPGERQQIDSEAFLVYRKFWGVPDASTLAEHLEAPLPTLPASLFIASEGTSGFITEGTMMVDRQKAFAKTIALHFYQLEKAMEFVIAARAIYSPPYFEIILQPAIEKYLQKDFPKVFPENEKRTEAYIIFRGEEDSREAVAKIAQSVLNLISGDEARITKTEVYPISHPPQLAGELTQPREMLPKKLKTKCKTDGEILYSFLPEAVNQMLAADAAKNIQNILFGHLSLPRSSILHWNVAGFDIYEQKESKQAWDHLNGVIRQLSNRKEGNPLQYAFSGEHGIAGKAPVFYREQIGEKEYLRIQKIKEVIDPKNIFNRNTIFSNAPAPQEPATKEFAKERLIPKALNFSAAEIVTARQESTLVDGIMIESAKCTRCTFCKTCPVIDAELEIGHKDPAKAEKILPDKREILYFLEKQVFSLSRAGKLSRELLSEMKSIAKRLGKCFYCRRCDEACPPSIDLIRVKSLFYEILGKKNWGQTWVRLLIDPMLLWPDFKKFYISAIALLQRVTRPLTKLIGRSLARHNPWQTYVNLPEFSAKKYDPLKEGAFVTEKKDNYVIQGIHLIDTFDGAEKEAPLSVNPEQSRRVDTAVTGYIRFRGCADTYFQSQASQAVTDYFVNVAKTPFVDLTHNFCCGFPYKADGFLDKASALINKLFKDILQACLTISRRHGIIKYSIFSNCPTCLEMLRDFVRNQKLLLNPNKGSPGNTDANTDECKLAFSNSYPAEDRELVDRIFSNMTISDSTSIVLEKARKINFDLSEEPIGLKVPCHNTSQITEHQLEFLGHHFKKVVAFTDCCGLSGIARYKHPHIGGQIASVLMEKIKESGVKNIVSGCPSCRDGVSIQKGAEGLDQIKSQDIFTAVLAGLKDSGSAYQPKK